METNYTQKSVNKQTPEAKEELKISKVTSGEVKKKKRSAFAEAFIREDVNNVKSYILTDVVVPAIKNVIIDTVTNGLNMMLNGDVRPSGSRRTNVSYSSMYSGRQRPEEKKYGRSVFNFDDIEFTMRTDAEEVLSTMYEILDVYGKVRVADFYELAGVTVEGHTDNYYGWYDLRSADVVRSRDCYVIRLPKPLPLDR